MTSIFLKHEFQNVYSQINFSKNDFEEMDNTESEGDITFLPCDNYEEMLKILDFSLIKKYKKIIDKDSSCFIGDYQSIKRDFCDIVLQYNKQTFNEFLEKELKKINTKIDIDIENIMNNPEILNHKKNIIKARKKTIEYEKSINKYIKENRIVLERGNYDKEESIEEFITFFRNKYKQIDNKNIIKGKEIIAEYFKSEEYKKMKYTYREKRFFNKTFFNNILQTNQFFKEYYMQRKGNITNVIIGWKLK